LLTSAVNTCAQYKPKFGRGRAGGTTLEEFQRLYSADPFYSWVGLDSPLMYAAHKAAGGMTSIYRQIGIGCEWIFNYILRDSLGLTYDEARWTYQVPMPNGRSRTLALDGRVEYDAIRNSKVNQRVQEWAKDAGNRLLLEPETFASIKGAVFEVRQGYKSKDSKRQNADIANASSAYAHLYLPVLVLFSTQIDGDVAARYTQARWLLMTGSTDGNSIDSTYVFSRDILGYDLAGFFQRNSPRIKTDIEQILVTLLEA